ncbi:MAG: polyphosphate kinase 2, partial [Hyphomicrobium sp.]
MTAKPRSTTTARAKTGAKAKTAKPVVGARERVRREIEDGFDEELELEFDEERLDIVRNDLIAGASPDALDRQIYFNELFRLQHELIKLQDWVVAQKLKLVVLFEGRDAAG